MTPCAVRPTMESHVFPVEGREAEDPVSPVPEVSAEADEERVERSAIRQDEAE